MLDLLIDVVLFVVTHVEINTNLGYPEPATLWPQCREAPDIGQNVMCNALAVSLMKAATCSSAKNLGEGRR